MGAIAATFLVVLGGAAAFGIGYWMWPLPDPQEIARKTDQSVSITFSDRTEMTRIVPSSGNRILVGDLRGEVSQEMRDATLAAEDISFYQNRGFDLTGILRAAWAQVTGGVGGGSTLTQQYIKLATGADEHSYFRKFKEIVLAFKVTNELPKDEILKAYLNTAYYGRGAYGIHAAAEAYFGKLPRDLDASESALLAGMVQRPTMNDPAYNPEQGRARWDYVAGQMREHGLVSAEESARMRLPETRNRFAWKGEELTGSVYHVRQQVLEEAERAGFTEDVLQRNGYTIITTIDPAAQQAAEAAVSAATHSGFPNLHAALVAVEPSTGAVRAYHSGAAAVGGYDWADAPQYPGSAFQPVVRLATIRDAAGALHSCTEPECRTATGLGEQSSGKVLASIRDTALRLGFSSRIAGGLDFAEPSGDSLNRMLAGEYPVSATDMAHAYATFAADGQERRPRFLDAIVDKDGREVASFESEPQPAFATDPEKSKSLARTFTSTLWPETARPAPSGTQPPVVDTGRYYSMTAWANGYTPQLATSVALSASDDENKAQGLFGPDGQPLDGSAAASGIWKVFMSDQDVRTARQQPHSRPGGP
ncbi:transglycosylase domain-containing protein [Saccharopolyspora elongata]|uniref:Penicillin-binding protein n=1 Tax=Saccharopolyspora elongata TaxID=2530387 RepID=A0A4V2YIS8_9PSEU|nr:transglycosylase domain-containing protein [Saccharopolyspora elongata]TDD36037.1 penicillin-binding protein [Saccharopolyspora elongata]